MHKVAFELRYLHGYTYLDRCGKIINTIMKSSGEWVPKPDLGPQRASMVSTANQCIFHFSSGSINFSIDQSSASEISSGETDRFGEQVGSLCSIVIDTLGVTEFPRIGLRSWYLFPCKTREETEKWLADVGIFSVDDRLAAAFDGDVESVGLAIVVSGGDRDYRIGLNGVERSIVMDLGSEIMSIRAGSMSKDQGKAYKLQMRQPGRILEDSRFAVMVDVDSYRSDPEEIDPEDFVKTSISDSRRRVQAALVKP